MEEDATEESASLRGKPFAEIAKIVSEEVNSEEAAEETGQGEPLQDGPFSETARTVSQGAQSRELDVTYASLGMRIAAYLIDVVILLVPTAALIGFIRYVHPEERDKLNLFLSIIDILYFSVSECSPAQATIGKRIMNLKVVGKSGNRLSFLRALARYLAKIISVLPLFAGILAIRTDDKHQGWHDLLCSTYVIEAK